VPYPSWTVNAYDLDLDGVHRLLDEWALPAYRARQVFAGLWARADTYQEMTDLPGGLRRRLDAELPAQLDVLTERSADRGATRKALLRVGGRHVIPSARCCVSYEFAVAPRRPQGTRNRAREIFLLAPAENAKRVGVDDLGDATHRGRDHGRAAR